MGWNDTVVTWVDVLVVVPPLLPVHQEGEVALFSALQKGGTIE